MSVAGKNNDMEARIEKIVAMIHGRGGRMTPQRRTLLRVILENPCSTCKELFYLSRKIDSSIGRATVYRTIKMLDDCGVLTGRLIGVTGV